VHTDQAALPEQPPNSRPYLHLLQGWHCPYPPELNCVKSHLEHTAFPWKSHPVYPYPTAQVPHATQVPVTLCWSWANEFLT